jgi:protein Mpv17
MIPTSCAVILRRTSASNSRTAHLLRNNAHLGLGTPTRVARRWTASGPPVAQKAPESAKSIPGPVWLWLEPVYEPFRAYGRVQRRRPYTTQFVSALVIYFVGDLVAQSLGPAPGAQQTPGAKAEVDEVESRGWVQAWAEERDWARTARALTIGGLAAVPGYRWFLW